MNTLNSNEAVGPVAQEALATGARITHLRRVLPAELDAHRLEEVAGRSICIRKNLA